MKNEIVTLSGFAGIGGFEVAAQMLGGFKFTDAIEIDPFRIEDITDPLSFRQPTQCQSTG